MIIYFSLSGNVEDFVDKLRYKGEIIEAVYGEPFDVDDEFILIVPTYTEFEQRLIYDFIDFGDNRNYFKGVVGSGHMNFNVDYCKTAVEVADFYNVPLLHNFELSGTKYDVEKVEREVENIWNLQN